MGREAESPVQYFEQESPVWQGERSGVFEFLYKQVLLSVCDVSLRKMESPG
jgi:hypothetical protein